MSDETQRRPVIVAEDMAVEREALELFLSDHGYDVQAVSHPDDIKDLPRCLALLMDVKFGAERFLGLEYVVQKRQSGELPESTLVIFMTHWRMRGDELKRAGRHEFLYKPFEYTQIRILLEKLLATEVRA